MESGRTIATVLFTDIVGSTERAMELGDRRWREVLRAHHEAVRDELRRHAGHEIGTAGDGFLAVFDSPGMALVCAAAIRDAVGELDLAVRCGLHMGEVQREDGDVGGIAVHIGARVAALAGAGEILVSGTLRDAEAGSDFEFEDRGRHPLKGIAGEWRIYALTGIPEDAAELAAAHEASLAERVRATRPLRVAAIYAAGGVAAFLVTLVLRAALDLPGWIPGVALVLLVVGLFVVAATAWVQARPQTLARTARGELPGSREVDLKGAARSLTRGELPHLTWGRAIAGGAFAFAMLFGAAGLYVVVKDRGRSFAPEEARADAAPGIAVLPFSVQGPGLDTWREGAVDLIGSNLDGAAGLRAIDSRTVLARWHETVKGEEPDLETSLDVARRTGARYALVGSAVALGRDLRLNADIYDLGTGRSIGQAQVQGAPDSVYMLVDRLSIESLQAILGGDAADLPRIDLARVTTASLPALKSYLDGELLYRKADWTGALADYREAIAADSTFALAWGRIAEAIGWLHGGDPAALNEAIGRAARYSDRLPERERIRVLALRALDSGSMTMLGPLRSAVQRYPDDPELVYLLGEHYVHFGDQLLVQPDETERTLARAIELDPTFAPYYQHAIEYAFYDADSARALDLVSRFERLAPGTREAHRYRLGATLAWGSPSQRASALAALDTLPPPVQPAYLLTAPRFLPLGLASAKAIVENGGPVVQLALFSWYGGRVETIERVLRKGGDLPAPSFRTAFLFILDQRGVKVDPAELRAAATADSLFPDSWFAAVLAARDGRSDAVRAAVTREEVRRETLLASGDTLAAGQVEGRMRALEGYAALQRGDRQRALALLQEGQRKATGWPPWIPVNFALRWTIAGLLVDLGRPEEAIPYYQSERFDPFAAVELGKVYERLGRVDEAKEQYETALAYWRDADPALQRRIAEVRQRLTGLGFKPRG